MRRLCGARGSTWWSGTRCLRTRFCWEGLERPLQVVERSVRSSWEERTASACEEQERRVRRAPGRGPPSGVRPRRAPLMRVTLVRRAEDRHRLVWSFHHALLDGWCLPLILKEVLGRTRRCAPGVARSLPPASVPRATSRGSQEQDLAAAERYWREALAGFRTPTPLAVDRAPSRSRDGSTATRTQAFADRAGGDVRP